MPIETFNFISDLVTTNPLHTEGLDEADYHLRGIKQTLVNTFPNINAAVTPSSVDLNGLVGAPRAATTSVGAGYVLKGASTGPEPDVLLQNAGGGFAVYTGNASTNTWTAILTIDSAGNGSFLGSLAAQVIKQAGATLMPPGMIMAWNGPANAIPGGWTLCDGTGGAPDLRDRFIVGAALDYAPGNVGGVVTQSATTAVAGTHAHGGATGPAGAITPTAFTNVAGGHAHSGSTQGHALTLDEMPNHDHGNPTGNVMRSNPSGTGGGGGNFISVQTFGAQGNNVPHVHPVSVDGDHAHPVTVSTIPDHQNPIAADGAHVHGVSFDNRPPFYALCYVMKL